MSHHSPARPRGFTLLELMVASSLSLIVLAAALWSAAELQRRGTFEESLMEAQNTLRAVRELLVVEVQRAGMGVGSARMMFGSLNAQIDPRYALTVRVQEPFDGSGYFPNDPTFAPPSPSGPYAGFMSDVLQVWSWDSGVVGGTGSPIGIVTLQECGNADSPHSYRVGNQLCANNATTDLKGRLIMVVRPGSLTACVMRVDSVTTEGGLNNLSRINVLPGMSSAHVVSDENCKGLPNNTLPSGSFWTKGGEDAYILLMRGSTFRVNWKSGRPVLERQDISSDLTATTNNTWTALSQDVEQIRFYQGVVREPLKAESEVDWLPDQVVNLGPPSNTTLKLPRIEACVPNYEPCDKYVNFLPPLATPTRPTLNADLASNRERLMIRLRMIRVQLVTRTARLDSSLIRPNNNNGFIPDDNGYPQDGYKRRSSTLEIMPRNFAYAAVR